MFIKRSLPRSKTGSLLFTTLNRGHNSPSLLAPRFAQGVKLKNSLTHGGAGESS